ncbi:MAG: hypothetical protein ACYTGR_20555, partial [Planctomycetota bacterium]
MAGGGLLAANKVSSLAKAYIDNAGVVLPTVGMTDDIEVGGALTLTASDTASIGAESDLAVSSVSTNNLDALKSVVGTLGLDDYQFTNASGAQDLVLGDRVRFVNGHGSASGTNDGVYMFIGDSTLTVEEIVALTFDELVAAATDSIDLGGAALDYDTDSRFLKLETADFEDILFPEIGNLTASDSQAFGGLVVTNDVRGEVEAYIANSDTTAAGNVTVTALETATLLAEAVSSVSSSGGSAFGTGTSLAVNGQIVTNTVLSSAKAYIDDATVTSTAGNIALDAQNTSAIDATLLSATSTGDTAVGITLAFNTLGWQPQNILFNAIDALLGDPLISEAFNGETPASVEAYITDSTVVSTIGSVSLTAENNAQLNATVSNAAISEASALFNASGQGFGGILASNKVSGSARAYIEDTDATTTSVTGGAGVTVFAEDNTGIFSNSKLVSSSTTTNDGGAAV